MTLLKRALPWSVCLVLVVALVARADTTSPDKKLRAVIDGDTIKIVDNDSNKELRAMRGHVGAVTAVTFSPDGRQLASGGNDKSVCCWDLATGKLLWKFKGDKVITSVDYSKDGKVLNATDEDKKEFKMDAATGKLM
jgi:WD40 repeat protein